MRVGRLPKLQVPTFSGSRLRTVSLQFLLALVLSLALWTFVSFSANPTIQQMLSVPVSFTPPPDNLIIVDPATGEPITPQIIASLDVVGPQREFDEEPAARFRALVDLTGLNAGLHALPVQVSGPRPLRVRRVEPSTVSVRLTREVTRTLDVELIQRNEPPFLYRVEDITAAAQQAVASGPEELMARVTHVIVPIDLSGRTTGFTEEVALVAVDSEERPVPGITLTPTRTNVSAVIAARVDTQRVPVAPRIINSPAPGYVPEDPDWSPRYVDVVSPARLEAAIETEPIDLSGRTESFTQTVRLINPDPSITRLLTDTVTVSVPIVPFQLPATVPWFVVVTPVNARPETPPQVQPSGLTITISGTSDQLRQLVTTSPQATVDVAGLGPGTYTLPVNVDLPPGLRLVGERPEVTVVIPPEPQPPPEGG
jgi:YbbR domain-containing protein